MERIEKAYKKGNSIAEELLLSYSKAEFFTKLPKIPEKIDVITYVAGVGDISTDLLSPGADAHSRSDRELHGQSIFDHNKKMQKDLLELQSNYPNKKILVIISFKSSPLSIGLGFKPIFSLSLISSKYLLNLFI